jgi:hypothetical protein
VALARRTWIGEVIPSCVAFGAHRLVGGVEPQVALAAADRAMYRQKRNAGLALSGARPAAEVRD